MGKMGMVRKGMALCLLVAVGSGCDYGALKKRNAALETAFKGVQTEKEGLQRELAHLKSTNDQLIAQLAASRQRTGTLENENGRLSRQVVSLTHAKPQVKKPAPKRVVRRTTAAPFKVPGTTVTREPGRVKVRLSNSLLFDPGKASLKKGAKATLDQVGRILKARYPKSVVGVEGHSDGTPIKRSKKRFSDNHDLSLHRARAVFDYLKATCRVPESRLFVAGYGAIRPEGPNKTRAGRARNRRVEIVVYTQ